MSFFRRLKECFDIKQLVVISYLTQDLGCWFLFVTHTLIIEISSTTHSLLSIAASELTFGLTVLYGTTSQCWRLPCDLQAPLAYESVGVLIVTPSGNHIYMLPF